MIGILLGGFLSAGTVSFENPGIRLELFLKEVSKQTGEGFRCPTYLNNEVLAASFKDQSIDVLKSQLARVIHGTWERKEDGWWLVQTSEQKKEEEKWVWESRNYLLQNQIDNLKSVAPKSEWTTKDAEKYWNDLQASKRRTGEGVWNSARRIAFRLQSPISRFCAAVSSQLTTKMFTENPLRVNFNRYSVNGLPGHIELPINIDQAVRQYKNEQQVLDMLSESSTVSGTPAHLELQYFSGERQYIMFSWLDKDWKYLGTQIPSFFANAKGFPAEGEIFPISSETRQMMEFVKEINSVQMASTVFEKYKDSPLFNDAVSSMTQATKRDPLGILQGRCWIDFANYVKKPLLVSLKDDEELPKPAQHVPTLTQKGFVVGMMRDDADGWILGRPINPMFNRAWRVDRSLIESYVNLVKKRDQQNVYAALRLSWITTKLLVFTSGIPNGAFLLDDQYPSGFLLAILGTLSEQEVNNCFNGKRIALAQLPQEGQDLLNLIAQEGTLTELSPLSHGETDTLCPLYYLPNGARGVSIGATIKSEPEFRFEHEPGPDYGKSLDVDEFATLLKEATPNSNVKDLKFAVGTRKLIVATAYMGNKSKDEHLSLSVPGSNLPTYTWKTLPEPIRQLVLEAMKDPGN